MAPLASSPPLPLVQEQAPALPLPLSAQERASLMRAGALALDATGHEVLMGLSVQQSQDYLAFLRQPTDAPEDLARHQALTLALERARLRRSTEAPERDGSAAVQAAMNA